MTFIFEALRDKPLAIYPLDDTSPFIDYSGYNQVSSFTGTTPATHLSLFKGVSNSKIFKSGSIGVFPSSVFKKGYEQESFSLEVWVRQVFPGTEEQQIIGNQNQMDGLVIEGTVVSFVTKYTTAPEARISYDLQMHSGFMASVVHTQDKNSLFINGLLVGEVSLTEEQQADEYASTNANLYVGATTGSQSIAVGGITIYGKTLTQEQISRHYQAGINVPVGEQVANSHGGKIIPVSLQNTDIFIDQWWSTAEQWNLGQRFNVVIVDDHLEPQIESDISIPGTWLDSFILSTSNVSSIYGVVVNWNGEGAVVEASLDGTTWEEAVRGTKLNLINDGFNPVDKELQIRVSFPGGIENDESYLDNLNIVGITTDASSPERDYEPIKLHDNWGTEIGATGSLTISAPSVAETVKTVELWIKRTTGTNPTINVSGTFYQDGASATTTLPQGQWRLVHITSSTNIDGAITITGAAQIGMVGLYTDQLNSSQVASIKANYFGYDPLITEEDSVIEITESSEEIDIYAHDWSIQTSG
jgi:hypothetical protein